MNGLYYERRKSVIFIGMLLFMTPLTGCEDSRIQLAPVTGTVQYRGENIPYGRIVFSVEGTRNGEAIIRDGQIVEATTYEPNDGIPIGMARLGVFGFKHAPTEAKKITQTELKSMNPGKSSGCEPEILPVLLPSKYNRPSESGLAFEVTASDPNILKLNLE